MSFDLKDGLIGVGTVVTIALIAVGVFFAVAVAGAVIGAVVGFLVSVCPFIGGWVVSGFAAFGITDVSLVSLGAMFGFIGGFFRSYMSQKSD